MTWGTAIRERLVPVSGAVPLDAAGLTVVLVVAAILCWGPAWQWVRLGATLVHEVGHAVVGILSGRRFTGFVVAGNASGHAITVGPERGLGRIATTWAGYPAPAVVGLAFVWSAAQGYAAATLGLLLLGSLALLIRVRSVTTVAVVGAALAATGSLWWWRSDALQAHALTTVGVILIAGAWRGLASVWRHGRAGDDPAVLRRLTGVPALLWILSWALTCAGATVAAARLLLTGVA
ncbi:MAG: M50 family metallopeptidase [Tetrasphaera jenkinsii]|jgi:hypothetical protein|uniref:Putative integral membrane protein n=1 Tax=Nostocoides jenkinsii Ben 74 TaxID=1193518 RepID=A0A077MGW6_9MICO|nr:M50 family metallopeptidase [Tetrasphaera jenkinsii]MCI1261832.1 M50 family metallopeptidase [Tetrasphaera jenkinsii]CCI54897.1 putative integral membrane protein [Tetrasphaera jenkinsii Ben 74]